jgi:hypothetical protein
VNAPARISRGIYVNRPNGVFVPGYARFHNNYAGWHHGYWTGWYRRPWRWFGGGVGAGWLLSSPSYSYSNPYWVAPAVPASAIFDYSQPIPVPPPVPVDLPSFGDSTTLGDSSFLDDSSFVGDSTLQGTPPTIANTPPTVASTPPIPAPPPDDSTDPQAVEARQLFDGARQAFREGNFDKAQELIDKAATLWSKDPTIHEFRALVLFAREKFAEATGVIYAVLAVGPGWDWDTLHSFYPDKATYEAQLRKLEAFSKVNPKDAASRFLLAYHYLILEDPNAARKMLQDVVALQPKDQLAAHLLSMLEEKDTQDRPKAAQ